MRKQLISKPAIDARKEKEKSLRDDMNIIKYDLFIRDYQNKVQNKTGSFNNLLNDFKPEHCALTITDCDIEQFNGEYYAVNNEQRYIKLDTSGGEYNFILKKMSGGVKTFGLQDNTDVPDPDGERKEGMRGFRKEKETYMKTLENEENERWCLCVSLKNSNLRKIRLDQGAEYVYYICAGTEEEQVEVYGCTVGKDESSYSYEFTQQKSTRMIPMKGNKWAMTPLGSKLIEYQDMGLQVGWPSYPHCAVSTPDLAEDGFWGKFGKGARNTIRGLATGVGELLSGLLPLTAGIGMGLLTGITIGGGWVVGILAGLAAAGVKYAAKQKMTGDYRVSEEDKEEKVREAAEAKKKGEKVKSSGHSWWKGRVGKTGAKSAILSKSAKKNQGVGLSKYLLSDETIGRIAKLGLSIRTTKDTNMLYQAAGQCPTGENCDKVNTAGKGEMINFFKHPINSKLPEIDGKDVDGDDWFQNRRLDQGAATSQLKEVIKKILEDAKEKNGKSLDISNKILYAVNDGTGVYDDEGTRILNNSVSDFERWNAADPNRASTRGGFSKTSINKRPDFFRGILPAFTKEECENPIMSGVNKRLYELSGATKDEAINWILRPENIDSLVVIANEMDAHDATIGGCFAL